jgi:hypothetical protein
MSTFSHASSPQSLQHTHNNNKEYAVNEDNVEETADHLAQDTQTAHA